MHMTSMTVHLRSISDTQAALGWAEGHNISNPESHKMYIAETRSAFRKYGAQFVVRGGKSEVVEGKARSRIVVIEFKDYALRSNVPWLTSLSLMAITVRSQRTHKRDQPVSSLRWIAC